MAAPTSRDDAPAYLLRAQERRARALLEQPAERDEPPFMARARRRATQRAITEMATPEAPPGRTVAFASETVAPRELQFPSSSAPALPRRSTSGSSATVRPRAT